MIPYQEGELEWHERRRWRSWKLRTQSQLLSEPEIRIFIPNWPGEKGKTKSPSFYIQFPQGLLVWGSHRADAFEERTGEEYREECSTKQPQDQEDLGAHVLKISIFKRFVCPQLKTPRQRVWSGKWRWCLCRGWWSLWWPDTIRVSPRHWSIRLGSFCFTRICFGKSYTRFHLVFTLEFLWWWHGFCITLQKLWYIDIHSCLDGNWDVQRFLRKNQFNIFLPNNSSN